MRIIAGLARGITLKAIVHKDIRPTSQKVREALFNILAEKVEGSVFFDLFAGTGAVGIEAISRGAARGLFLEKDRRAAQILRQNTAAAGFQDKSLIIEGDWRRKLQCARASQCDIIFFDPPYNFDFYQEVLDALVKNAILKKNGVIVVEHYHKCRPAYDSSLFVPLRNEKYGETGLFFLGLNEKI